MDKLGSLTGDVLSSAIKEAMELVIHGEKVVSPIFSKHSNIFKSLLDSVGVKKASNFSDYLYNQVTGSVRETYYSSYKDSKSLYEGLLDDLGFTTDTLLYDQYDSLKHQ